MTDTSDNQVEDSLMTLDDVYNVGLKFFKEKEGKAFHLKYADRLKLCAYVKQVKFGPYDPNNAPDVGFLDLVGSNRREMWRQLGDMDSSEAKKGFLNLLDKCCPLWAPYLEAHQREAQEKERRRLEEERKEREARAAAEAAAAVAKAQQEAASWAQALSAADAQRRMVQEAQIRSALNQQTIGQFRHYAMQQHPNDSEKQEELIRQLQEQHFQQYITQVYRQQLQRQRVQFTKSGRAVTGEAVSSDSTPMNGVSSGGDRVDSNGEPSPKENNLDGASNANGNGTLAGPPTHPSELPPLAAASMWTRKDVQEFKASLNGDAEGTFTVGSGECVTIRVPTHDKGTFISWEFVTDSFDIGFGLYFEWSHPDTTEMTVHVSRGNSDDEGETDEAEDALKEEQPKIPEKPSQAQVGETSKTNDAEVEGPIVDEIVPIYRRDSQAEVYCGSHQYPGRGVYLLKFDNSYSLWRSKTLYYRVFYTR